MPLLRKKGLFESTRVLFLPVSSIAPNPNQPRQTFDPQGIEELANSIREHGILQPLSVRRGDAGYELVSGERRLRAAKLAGLGQVPCILVSVDDLNSSLLALVENLQRRDLDFWEEAQALYKLIHTCSLSQEEAARRIGKSQSAVANKLRLLKLPPPALELLRQGGCTERHARALLTLPTPELQLQVARKVAEEHLTVALTEAYISSLLSQSPPKKRPRKKPAFILKDVRLFLNTVTRGLAMMQSAGVDAQCGRQETEDAILLTIRIPK
jgi:ParB family chromosome partitioning protein